MTPQRRPGCPHGDEPFVVRASWDGEMWAVSVANRGGEGRANTSAATLAEVLPNAAVVIQALTRPRPSSLVSRIEVDVRLDPDLAERYETVRDPHDAAAVLHAAGMCRDDISTIVLSRLHAIASERGFAHER